MVKVLIVSLGCNKNLVDSEVMAGYLKKGGMLLTDKAEEADKDSVKREHDGDKMRSLKAIQEAAAWQCRAAELSDTAHIVMPDCCSNGRSNTD